MLLFVQSMRSWLARKAPWSNSRQAWRERGAVLLVLAAALAQWRFAGGFSPPVQVVLWAGLLLVSAYLWRRSWVQLFGPVLLFEMVRSGRRPRHLIFRTTYALLLLGILFCVYSAWFLDRRESTWQLILGGSLRARDLADFAGSFFYVFMSVQFLMIIWLTPGYTAGAITVEKERQTLDALLATDLRNHEIVLSTYVSRLANLVMLLLAGMPILAMLQFLGGVDPNLILAGFGAGGLTLVSLAALGTMNSLFARRPRDAILRTYLVAIGYLLLSGASWLLLLPQLHLSTFPSTDNWTSPVELRDVVEWASIGNPLAAVGQVADGINRGGHLDVLLPPMLEKYAWFHGLVAIGCCALTVIRFRDKALEPRELLLEKTRRVRLSRWTRWRHWRARPAVTRRPILWKEMFVDALGRRRLWGRLSSGILLAGVFLPAVHLLFFFGRFWPDRPGDHLSVLLNYWVRGASALIGSAMLLGVAVRAASCVSGERDRQTLEGLLATPLGNRTILLEKWLGCIFSQRRPWLALAMVWALGFLTGGLHLPAVGCFVLGWLAYAAFLAGLGLWFSVANRSTLRSIFGTLCTTVLILGILLLIAFDIPESWMPKWLYVDWPLITLPPTTLGVLAFSPANLDDWLAGKMELNYLPLILVLQFVAWSLTSVLLVYLANIRFRVVTGRTSGLPNPPCSLSESDQAKLVSPSKAASPDPLSKKKEKEEIQFEDVASGGFSKRLVGGTLLLLPCCLMLCWYGYTHWAAEKSLEEAITNADRLDPGWRLQDLEDKRAVIPDPENSSLLIREVKAHLPENWEYARYQKFYEQFVDLDPEKQLNDEQVKKLTEVFENHEPVLILARRLADMPRGRAPITWSKDGLFIILNDTQNARTTVNFLRYDALLRSQENDADGALESCRAIVNAGRSIGDEPSLISTLMRIATNGIAHNALERSLAQGQPRDESMRVLQRLLEDEEKEPILLYGIRGERACWDRVLERLQNGTTGVKNVRGLWGGADEVVLMSGSLKGQRALLLQIMNENVEAAKLPLEQQEAEFTSIDKSISLKSAVVRMLIPAGVRIEQAFVRSRALLRTDIVALAVERYRREHGRWPDSLAELVPNYLQQLYTDPYDGKPLRYRRNSDGVVIYSIGPDKTDDGGKLDRVKVGTTGSDVGIQLWDPEKRRQPPPPPTADATAAEAQESPDDDK